MSNLSKWLIGPGLWLRIREEEVMLLAEFGDEYREYMARTARLSLRPMGSTGVVLSQSKGSPCSSGRGLATKPGGWCPSCSELNDKEIPNR
ncbi:MAG: methyltransferase family protein [Anaerolineae bacterium]